MDAHIRGILHAIVNIGGNGVIFEFVPVEYRWIGFLVFNVIQVVYAYLDPTYTYHKLGKTK